MPPIPKPTRRPSKRARMRAASRVVNPQVDARDGFVCRCCGVGCDRTLPPTYARSWHRHHIVYRSACGQETTGNKVGICGACHHAVHVTRTLRISGDADAVLTFTDTRQAVA